jgi:N-acetylglucosamine kinase-like BadF-type ATPase
MPTLGLGIDGGGTRTRWALAAADGATLAAGEFAGCSALQLAEPGGREALAATFSAIAREIAGEVRRHDQPVRIVAGLTGFAGPADEARPALAALLAEAFGTEPAAVELLADVELAYRSAFEPGAGFLVYAGTGSIAVFVSREGTLSRAGGRGALLDDGGSGFWIAREAFRTVWRGEDESPGSWRESALARRLFAQVGGPDWLTSRQFLYGRSRGEVGELALLVAETAADDVRSTQILMDAGRELARLANVMTKRFGRKPIALAGRAIALHPLIEQSFRASLAHRGEVTIFAGESHVTAARLAAGGFRRDANGFDASR